MTIQAINNIHPGFKLAAIVGAYTVSGPLAVAITTIFAGAAMSGICRKAKKVVDGANRVVDGAEQVVKQASQIVDQTNQILNEVHVATKKAEKVVENAEQVVKKTGEAADKLKQINARHSSLRGKIGSALNLFRGSSA